MASEKEVAMLDALLVDVSRLTEKEANAFSEFKDALEKGRLQRLTVPQLDWVKGAYRRLELDAEEGSLNLYSSGKVPDGVAKPKSDGELKAVGILSSLPLFPPGRMPKEGGIKVLGGTDGGTGQRESDGGMAQVASVCGGADEVRRPLRRGRKKKV